jgi:hypothetical protein
MDMVPEEIVALEVVKAAFSSKAGPSRPALLPMKYWPAPPKAPSAPKKVHITTPVTGKQSFAQVANSMPKPPVKPQSSALDLTPEAIIALARAFPNMMVEKILELRATLTRASGTLAPCPPTPAMSAATSHAPPPAKKPKTTTQGPSRKIILLSFDGFVPKVDCPKAVDDINAILATFPLGIRAQVMTHMYQAYGIEMTCVPIPVEMGQLIETLNHKSQVFRNFGMLWFMTLPQSKSYCKLLDIPHSTNSIEITSDAVETALRQSPFGEHIVLCSRPWLVCTSQASQVAQACFEVWDSQNGT